MLLVFCFWMGILLCSLLADLCTYSCTISLFWMEVTTQKKKKKSPILMVIIVINLKLQKWCAYCLGHYFILQLCQKICDLFMYFFGRSDLFMLTSLCFHIVGIHRCTASCDIRSLLSFPSSNLYCWNEVGISSFFLIYLFWRKESPYLWFH